MLVSCLSSIFGKIVS